jgi:hypothetical protein
MPRTTTGLEDLIFGDEYVEYATEKSVDLDAFIQSGVAQESPDLNQLAAGQGGTYVMPFFKPLANDDPNISSDDDSVIGARKKATTGAQKARLSMYNQIWSSADINKAMIAADPLEVIAQMSGKYWATWRQKMTIHSALGVLADNDANDGDDMLINVSAGANLAARRFTPSVMIQAGQTMGDHKNTLKAIAVHSVVHADWQEQGALVEHYDPETGNLAYETFQGKRVIVDDGMPVQLVEFDDDPLVERLVYTSIVFGEGAIQIGNGVPKVPVEYARDARAANGGGVEDLIERKHMIVHPVGMAWLDASVAGVSPSKAELATAANWNRVWQRKNVPLAFVKTCVV